MPTLRRTRNDHESLGAMQTHIYTFTSVNYALDIFGKHYAVAVGTVCASQVKQSQFARIHTAEPTNRAGPTGQTVMLSQCVWRARDT